MRQLDTDLFLRLFRNLHFMEGAYMLTRPGDGPAVVSVDQAMRKDAAETSRLLGDLGLKLSQIEATRMQQAYAGSAQLDTKDAAARIRTLSDRVRDELRFCHLFVLTEAEAEQYADQLPFGQSVFDAFPSANEDISEATKCLELGRGTACVMHLMRACEVGLKALGAALGVPVQNDWGSYLRLIEKELAARLKASGARSSDEQFYAEASISFDTLKRAWRNPTMHVDRAYSTERAGEIHVAVGSLLGHLSTRLRE